ncbi:MAG: VCBS repeat-containing protein [Deltaproteobacteria bacterium]|nr:VCBS repeat-containing protein [Deltaproteobacteria bacterium]
MGLGCAPRVIQVDDDSGGGSSGEPTTTGGGMPPSPPQTTLTAGDGTASDGPADSGDLPPEPLCWQSVPMFEAPSNVRPLVLDQDSDGREELWLIFDSDGGAGPEPGETTVFAIEQSGTTTAEIVFDGFVLRLGDITGDGLADIVTFTFAGGPQFGFLPATGPASFSPRMVPLEVELSPFVTGFFDLTEDGFADLLIGESNTELALYVGDGQGGMGLSGSVELPELDFANVSPVADAPTLAVLTTVVGNPGADCVRTRNRLLEVERGLPSLRYDALPAEVPYGPLIDARAFDEETGAIYLESCNLRSVAHELRVLRWSPRAPVLEEISRINGGRMAAVGDFDGDGLTDLLSSPFPDRQLAFAPGLDRWTFAEPTPIEVGSGEVFRGSVRAVDFDGDGRDELVRGIVQEPGDPAELLFERVFLGPC